MDNIKPSGVDPRLSSGQIRPDQAQAPQPQPMPTLQQMGVKTRKGGR